MDASALIGLGERHYPERLPLFKPIWDHIYEGIDSGEIISVDFVKIEINRRADEWRNDFLAKANKMFQISQDIEKEYASLIKDIEFRSEFVNNKHRDRFMDGADPWIIALAIHIGDSIVVSTETKSLTNYGMGAVCEILGIDHMNLVEFFDANNIGM